MTRPHQSRREFLTSAVVAGAMAALPVETATAQSTPSTFVLVHGAWFGGWCWRRVADQLTAKGHYVVAPTLSGLCERSHLASDAINLTTHIDDIASEIKWKDLDQIVLVGHSYGGFVVTGVAERMRERIASIVYLDAFIPLDGQSFASLRRNPDAPLPTPMVPAPTAAYFKVNTKDAAWVDSKVTPHPTNCFTEKLHVTDAYQSIPKKVYIRAPAFQQPAFDAAYARCRADKSWTTYEMSGGHDLMIDQPAEVCAVLERAST